MANQPRHWKPPTRRRTAAVRDRLRRAFGAPFLREHKAPLDELILTVLSQNTNDRNRDVAFSRLRERMPDWEDVLKAPVSKIEAAIRPGGISKVKSVRIKEILKEVDRECTARGVGTLDLSWLQRVPRIEARQFLESLPGVGRKTAACVLLFSYGIPEIPVDTHVYRTTSRLGLIRPGCSFEEAHVTVLEVVNPADAYEFHVNLLRLGRRICKASNPDCPSCPLLTLCPHGKSRTMR